MSDWGLFTHYIKLDQLKFYDLSITDKNNQSHNHFYVNKLLFNKVVRVVIEKDKLQYLDHYLDEIALKKSIKDQLKVISCPCNFHVYSNQARIEDDKLKVSKKIVYEKAIR